MNKKELVEDLIINLNEMINDRIIEHKKPKTQQTEFNKGYINGWIHSLNYCISHLKRLEK